RFAGSPDRYALPSLGRAILAEAAAENAEPGQSRAKQQERRRLRRRSRLDRLGAVDERTVTVQRAERVQCERVQVSVNKRARLVVGEALGAPGGSVCEHREQHTRRVTGEIRALLVGSISEEADRKSTCLNSS